VTVAKKWVDVADLRFFPYFAPYDKALRVGLILRLRFGLRLRDVPTRVTIIESNLTLDGQRVGCTYTTTATPSASPTSGSAAAQWHAATTTAASATSAPTTPTSLLRLGLMVAADVKGSIVVL
jgi:hypothetical protein